MSFIPTPSLPLILIACSTCMQKMKEKQHVICSMDVTPSVHIQISRKPIYILYQPWMKTGQVPMLRLLQHVYIARKETTCGFAVLSLQPSLKFQTLIYLEIGLVSWQVLALFL